MATEPDAVDRGRRRAALTALAFAASPLAQARRPAPGLLVRAGDLRRDLEQRASIAVVALLFSLPDCGYCETVRRNYLAPLTRDATYSGRLLIREIGLTDAAPIVAFAGERSSGVTLAMRYGAKVAPTVVFVDRAGVLLAAPLIGGDVAGFYGAFFDRALAEAFGKAGQGDGAEPSSPAATVAAARP